MTGSASFRRASPSMAALLAAACALAPHPAAEAGQSGPVRVTTVLHPTFDTYLEGTSTTALHWLPTLLVSHREAAEAPVTRSAFLRFDVSQAALPGTVVDARLELTLQAGAPDPGAVQLAAARVETDDWTVPNTAAATDIADTTGPLVRRGDRFVYSAGVGDAARQDRAGDGALSLKVYAPAAGPATLAFPSQDAGDGPELPSLVVTTAVDAATARAHAAAASDLSVTRHQVDAMLRRPGAELRLREEAPLGSRLRWRSSDEQLVTDSGHVTRPSASLPDGSVLLDLTVTQGAVTLVDRFRVSVPHSDQVAAPVTPAYAVQHVALESGATALIDRQWGGVFEHVQSPVQHLDAVVDVRPGERIQPAVDAMGARGGGVVHLVGGLHRVQGRIDLRSGVSLVGDGPGLTVVQQDGSGDTIGTTLRQLTDVVLKDFTLQGIRGAASVSNGVLLAGSDPQSARHSRIMLQNVTVKNFGSMGIHMKRTANIILDRVASLYNGEANGLFHNLYLLYDNNVLQSDTDLSRPVLGKGAKYTSTSNVLVQRAKIRDAIGNGIQADGPEDTKILFYDYTVAGAGKTALWFISEDFKHPTPPTYDPANAPKHVILAKSHITGNLRGGVWKALTDVYVVDTVFANRQSDLMLLNTQPVFVRTGFSIAPTYHTDPNDLPLY